MGQSASLDSIKPTSFWNEDGPHSVLITGGGSGIGLGIAKRLVSKGHSVLIVGRRLNQLEVAKSECPQLSIMQGDVSTEQGRISLFDKIIKEFPQVNVLINNAGIQNRPPPLTKPQDFSQHFNEVSINLLGPMHLSMLFIDHLTSKKSSQIINVTSGLAFCPISFMPTYCATKAALHSFTLSLRHQLKDTGIKVVEIIPPAVKTDLGGKGLHNFGEDLDEFSDFVLAKLESDNNIEIGFKMSEKMMSASRAELDASFKAMNSRNW